MQVQILGREHVLEKERATHSSQYSCLGNPRDRGAMGLGGYSSWGCEESDMTEQLSTHTVIRRRNDPLTSHSNYRQYEKLSSHYFEEICFLKQKMPINKCRELQIIDLCHKGRSKSLCHRNEMLRMTLTHTAKSVTPLLYNLKSEIFQKKKNVCFFPLQTEYLQM